MRLRRDLLGVLTAAWALWAAGGAAADELPVPWTGDFSRQAAAPNSPPAGANDWDCKPPKRHPRPVVLVHGLGGNRTTNWPTMSPFLANRGYCVFALTYGTKDNVDFGFYQPGGLVPMEESAEELKRFVTRVRRAAGARRVDIVGHSEGSLMPNYWVKFLGGHRRVAKYVGLTPLWDGTNLAAAGQLAALGAASGGDEEFYSLLEPYCASCRQLVAGSDFIRKMNDGGGPRVPGVDYTMIMTRNDGLVVPYTSGLMEGAENVVVQDVCALDQSEHVSVIFDPIAAYTILNALEPRAEHDVPCVPVLPVLGAIGYSE
jgi:triacylglycerol esterase/lipase EstA (alpha/beta hydrolase family)